MAGGEGVSSGHTAVSTETTSLKSEVGSVPKRKVLLVIKGGFGDKEKIIGMYHSHLMLDNSITTANSPHLIVPHNIELDLLFYIWGMFVRYSGKHLSLLGDNYEFLHKWAEYIVSILCLAVLSLMYFRMNFWTVHLRNPQMKSGNVTITIISLPTGSTGRHDKGLTRGMLCGLLTKYTFNM